MENIYLLNKEIRKSIMDGNYFNDEEKISILTLNENNSVVNKLIETSNRVQDFITKILSILRDRFESVMKNSVNKIKGKLNSNKAFKDKLSEIKENSSFISEINLCKSVAKFYKEELVGKFLSSVKENLVKSLSVKENVEIIIENHNVDKNVISNIANKLSHIPPFSWLHSIQKLGEKTSTNIVSTMSNFTSKLGGPEFTLPITCALLGIAFELNVKGLIKTGIIDMISYYSIPYIALAVKFIGLVATFIAVVDIIDEITSRKEVREI